MNQSVTHVVEFPDGMRINSAKKDLGKIRAEAEAQGFKVKFHSLSNLNGAKNKYLRRMAHNTKKNEEQARRKANRADRQHEESALQQQRHYMIELMGKRIWTVDPAAKARKLKKARAEIKKALRGSIMDRMTRKVRRFFGRANANEQARNVKKAIEKKAI